MSLFGGGGGVGGTGGLIGQQLGLTRSTTIAPQNGGAVPSFGVQPQLGGNSGPTPSSIGVQFALVQPQNSSVAQKVVNNKSGEINSFVCCISGQGQFQQHSIYEIALQDRRLVKGGQARPPQGNLQSIQTGAGAVGGAAGVTPFSLNGGTPAGGLFATSAPNTTPATGGIFGGQPTGLGLGGLQPANPAPLLQAAPQKKGLFDTVAPTQPTAGGIFGNQPVGGGQGLFGQTTTTTGTAGGLFGQTATTGGMFGQTTGTVGGGLFGPQTTNAGATTGGIFGQLQNPNANMFGQAGQQQQQQQQVASTARMDEMIKEFQRLEQAKNFNLTQKRKEEEQEEGRSGRQFMQVKNSINQINYLKNQQQQRDVQELYSRKNPNSHVPFIEAPYNVKLNVTSDNVKRNEWVLLQRQQDKRNPQIGLNANLGNGNNNNNNNSNSVSAANNSIQNDSNRGIFLNQQLARSSNVGATLASANHLHTSSLSMYSQLRQIERATSYAHSTRSLQEMNTIYKKDHQDQFSETPYFKKMQKVVEEQERGRWHDESIRSNEDTSLKHNSIAYLYEQSLKNQVKTFKTTLNLQLYPNSEMVIIPLEVKSSFTISYLLTLAFDYIEDVLQIQPENLPIYKSNYILYQPVNIDHLLQVQKENLISELEPTLLGEIGHFELVLLEEEDRRDVLGEDEMDEEDYDEIEFEDQSFSDSQKLPIIGEGYTIFPSLEELSTKSIDQLKRFRNFRIRNEFAEICFEEPIDLFARDFTKDLIINENEILIHPNQASGIIVGPGYGLNVRSTIKRFNAFKLLMPGSKYDAQKMERCIRKIAEEYQMEIVEPYNFTTDSFTVRIQSF